MLVALGVQSVRYLPLETARVIDVIFNACGCWIAAQMDTEGRAPVLGYAGYIPGYTRKASQTDVPTGQDGRININCDGAEKPNP